MNGYVAGARDLIAAVVDPGSYASWDAPAVDPPAASAAYRSDLARARAAAGTDESVLTGSGTVGGRRAALIVSEFAFLGGSVGVACADRIDAAIRRATAEGLPLLAAPASGGTRMQEGALAFVQMIGITAAISAHRAAGLPYLVYLRHPTMGGVFASWGSLGHVTLAEPGALLGFMGPVVYQALHGTPFPAGIQTAENLARHGVIDAVVPPTGLGPLVSRVLRLTAGPAAAAAGADRTGGAGTGVAGADGTGVPPAVSAWTAVTRTRAPGRPGLRELLRHAARDLVPLAGTNAGAHPGLVIALVRLGGAPCALVGQDRAAQRAHGPLGPADLRQARQRVRASAELGLPLVTVIDTPGLSLSVSAEEGGLSAEIAQCLADLLALRTPAVSVLLGEGTGGGALALLPADRVIAVADAWLAPLPPEGASAITHRGDPAHAAALADEQGVTAGRLAADGIVDVVVPAPGDDAARFARDLGAVIARELAVAGSVPPRRRLAARAGKFRGRR